MKLLSSKERVQRITVSRLRASERHAHKNDRVTSFTRSLITDPTNKNIWVIFVTRTLYLKSVFECGRYLRQYIKGRIIETIARDCQPTGLPPVTWNSDCGRLVTPVHMFVMTHFVVTVQLHRSNQSTKAAATLTKPDREQCATTKSEGKRRGEFSSTYGR